MNVKLREVSLRLFTLEILDLLSVQIVSLVGKINPNLQTASLSGCRKYKIQNLKSKID